MGAGSKYSPAKMPEKPITVYSYEASPFCKLVREKLVELEIPHLLKVGTADCKLNSRLTQS